MKIYSFYLKLLKKIDISNSVLIREIENELFSCLSTSEQERIKTFHLTIQNTYDFTKNRKITDFKVKND